jgi:hypothetical protein
MKNINSKCHHKAFLLHEVEKYSPNETIKFYVDKYLDICRKEVDNIWTVSRYCDDTGKSDEQIIKVRNGLLLYFV